MTSNISVVKKETLVLGIRPNDRGGVPQTAQTADDLGSAWNSCWHHRYCKFAAAGYIQSENARSRDRSGKYRHAFRPAIGDSFCILDDGLVWLIAGHYFNSELDWQRVQLENNSPGARLKREPFQVYRCQIGIFGIA